MTNTPGQIRSIAWREIFPWLILFRTFRIAISPPLLALATAAVLITPLGWRLASGVFLTPDQRAAQALLPPPAATLPLAVQAWFPSGPGNAILSTYSDLTRPLFRLFRLDLTLSEAAYYAFGFLWMMAIWSFPGGVITRRAVVQLATDDPLGIRPAATYAAQKYPWYLLTPLYPLLGIFALAAPIAVLGWLVWLLPGIGTFLAGVFWLFVAIAGVAALWLIGGLILGWPLMWPTISAERDGDPFEAFSRSYAYVYGKPLHYFFYIVVAAIFGTLCLAVVWAAATIVQEFGFWALSWGSGGPAAAEIWAHARDVADGEFHRSKLGVLWTSGATLIGLVVALIDAVVVAFRFSFFFCTASAIYLLLRHDVDEKEMDEVFVEPQPITAPPPAATPHTAD